MDYTELQQMAIDTAEEFARKKIEPIAAIIDEKEEFPVDMIREMGQHGLLGIMFPDEYGGAGLDYVTYAAVISKIARVCASTAMTVVAHSTLTGYPIYKFGSEEQREKFLKPLIAGEKIGAFALTEPNAGSDVAGIETKAIFENDRYIMNGSKTFITSANYADAFVVAAKTDPEKGMMGISLFLLDRNIKGFEITGKKEKKLGMRGSDTGELIFQDAVVPMKCLLGRKNFGLQLLHETLTRARIGMGAIALGISEGAQAQCLGYVRQRKQFGQTLANFQTVKNMIADMEMNISAGRLLVEKAARYCDRGLDIAKVASEAKLFASEAAMKITKDAIQLFGGYGYSREFPLERFFRDAKLTEIGDGTSEIQRLIIADEILKRTKRG